MGTRFAICLPAATPPAVSPAGRSDRTETAHERSLNILLIDDNADLAAGMARLLKILGHMVEIVQDGPTGLASVRSKPPDIVLLDIGLPGMDGYQVARILREEGFRDLVIVAVSGYAEEQSTFSSRETGFDHHLTKPVDFESLEALLGRLNKST